MAERILALRPGASPHESKSAHLKQTHRRLAATLADQQSGRRVSQLDHRHLRVGNSKSPEDYLRGSLVVVVQERSAIGLFIPPDRIQHIVAQPKALFAELFEERNDSRNYADPPCRHEDTDGANHL